MAGKANKQNKKSSSSSTVNGVGYSNGCVQKNCAKDSEDDQNSNIVGFNTSTTNSSATHLPGKTTELHAAHEPTASCSVESQTDFFTISGAKSPEDGLINFIKLSPWSRIETLCEIVKVLNPQEVRLVGACLEGSARPVAAQLKRLELCANRVEYLQNILDSRAAYPAIVRETFDLICFLSSTNRPAAYLYVTIIDKLMADRRRQLGRLTEDVRLDTLQNLGKLVTAALHHPAFTTDQCMRMEAARDELIAYYEIIHPPHDFAPPGVSPPPAALTFIRRITASMNKNLGDGEFVIELQWNDGQNTWVNRTRAEIASLHHRLLDAFGDERRDETTNPPVISSPTIQQAPVTRTLSRILPYFNDNMNDAEVVEYLNGLSDLPARMMLSSVIYEEFYVSRQNSAEEANESGYARSPPTIGRTPLTAPIKGSMPIKALCYSSSANGELQFANIPTCSNCAGDHFFLQCPKKNIMEVSQSGKDGYRIGVNSPAEEQELYPNRPTVTPQFPPGFYSHVLMFPQAPNSQFPLVLPPNLTTNPVPMMPPLPPQPDQL